MEEYAVLNQGWLAESARLAKSIPVIETFAWHYSIMSTAADLQSV
jgi:hypothetical protein